MKPSLTIGIEEEYQTIDPETRDLRSHIDAEIIEQGKTLLKEAVKAEMHQSVVEIGTGVCQNIKEACHQVKNLRSQVCDLARRNGLHLASSGTHPFADWRKQEITEDDRYQVIVEDLGMVARANLIFGLHVHIGVEDRETGIQLMNAARYFLPHILALSTNSPFWLGMETGLKSYRCKVFDKFPRTNIPDYFPSWGEYERFVDLLVRTNCIDNAKKIWWDIRPHPNFPTLEFRICDVPMRADETIAIAALIQATVAKLYKLHEANQGFRLYRRALIMENKWRALRYGLDGKIIDFGKQTEVPVRDLIYEYLAFIDDVVDELGSRDEINYIHHILENGTGADRQLRVFRETGDLTKVVDYIVSETEANLGRKEAVVGAAGGNAMSTDLQGMSFDRELTQGAHNAVYVCLQVKPSEKVTVITDRATREIAASLVAELEKSGCTFRSFVLEDLAPRPLQTMPEIVLEDLQSSNVSIFAVHAQANELKTRMQMCEVVNRHKLRHAHMVNIEKRIMLEGMRADFAKVDELTLRVMNIANKASYLRAVTPAGTDIRAELSPDLRWIKTSGIISQDKWGNLPGGETFTSPLEVNGTFVVDGVVGDYLCAKYGDLHHQPLTLRIEKNRLTHAFSDNKELEHEFWEYTHRDENSNRVGELAIGTNLAVSEVVGNILQDEKIPGLHLAFGDPYGSHTGAKWSSTTHIDVVGRDFDIWAEKLQIMKQGRFVV